MLNNLGRWANFIVKFYSFRDKKSAQMRLIDLPSVRLTYSVCIALTTLSLSTIILTSDISFKPDFDGLNNLPTIFKIPLSILALAIPIMALIASNHRSEQTKAQIVLAESNTNFSNYYKHTEEFENYVDEHSGELSIVRPRKFHRLAFPDAKSGSFKVSINFIEDVDDRILRVCSHTKKYETDGALYWRTHASNFRQAVNALQKDYFMEWTEERLPPSENSPDYKLDSPLIFSNESLRDILKELGTTATRINEALHFDETYTPSTIMKNITLLDFSQLPILNSDHNVNHADMRNFNLSRRVKSIPETD